MKIAVVGLGFVGATVAAGFAEKGHSVVGIENNEERYTSFRQGIVPFYEPQLESLVQKNLAEGRLRIVQNTAEGIQDEDLEVILLAVGTPPKEDGRPDLKYMETAAREIAKSLEHHVVIAEKSTVPIRTGEWLKKVLSEHIKCGFDIAACPEFLRESTAVYDFFNPDRIVIGTETEQAYATLRRLYRSIGDNVNILPQMAVGDAEMTKHASNMRLYLELAVTYLMSQTGDALGFNCERVLNAMGLDRRIGPYFKKPGPGAGGFCLRKDLDALISICKDAGIDTGLFEQIIKIDDSQRKYVVDKIEKMLGGNLEGKRVGVLGLSFKKDTSDVRYSPAIEIIRVLQRKGAEVIAYDPKAMNEARKILPDIKYCTDAYEVARQSEAIAMLTEWDEFTNLNKMRIRQGTNKIIDARNIFDPVIMRQLGFEYDSLGRPWQSFK